MNKKDCLSKYIRIVYATMSITIIHNNIYLSFFISVFFSLNTSLEVCFLESDEIKSNKYDQIII